MGDATPTGAGAATPSTSGINDSASVDAASNGNSGHKGFPVFIHYGDPDIYGECVSMRVSVAMYERVSVAMRVSM
jgi:hypothetical protein